MNAIQFFKNVGIQRVECILSWADEGAEFYHPIARKYYRMYLGVVFSFDFEANRWTKFIGLIDTTQFILIEDLQDLVKAHKYVDELGYLS